MAGYDRKTAAISGGGSFFHIPRGNLYNPHHVIIHQNRLVIRLCFGECSEPAFPVEIFSAAKGIYGNETASSSRVIVIPGFDKCQNLAAQSGTLCFITDSQTAHFDGRIRRSSLCIRDISRKAVPDPGICKVSLNLVMQNAEVCQNRMCIIIFDDIRYGQSLLFIHSGIRRRGGGINQKTVQICISTVERFKCIRCRLGFSVGVAHSANVQQTFTFS